jgi:hypothetical protein
MLTLHFLLSSQTPTIAAKATLSDAKNTKSENDFFGLGPESFIIFQTYKVERLKNSCIVEHKENIDNKKLKKTDTICDHPYFTGQYTMDEILLFYPKGTSFVGFKNHYFNDSIPEKKQSINFYYVLIIATFLLITKKVYKSYAIFRK